MTHDEAKSLGQAALERLDKISGRLEWEHAIHDLATGLDMLHGMVVRLEDALKVSAEQVRVEMEQRKAAELRLASTGQMAAHYKLQAQGGNYDATQEDCPGCAEQWNAALEAAAHVADGETCSGCTNIACSQSKRLAAMIRALKKP